MKTEIDVHYLVALENDNKKKQETINELNSRLSSLNEYTLRREAVDYAERCFKKMVQDLFKAIGADSVNVGNYLYDFSAFANSSGKMPDLVFEFEASIKKAAKNAYIMIGVDFSKVNDEKHS